MSYEEWMPTLHASELTSGGSPSSRDTKRQSLRDLHMLESENANLRRMMQLLQDNRLYKSHIKSSYGTRSMSPILSSSPVETSFLAGSAVKSSRPTTPSIAPPPARHSITSSSHLGATKAGTTSPVFASTIRASPSPIAPPQFTSTRQFNPSKPTLKLPSYDEVKTAYVAKVSRSSTCDVDSRCTCPVGKKGQRSERCVFLPTACTDTAKNGAISQKPSKVRSGATTVQPSPRMLGEIAFQLDKRILDYIFYPSDKEETGERKKRRFYGYTVKNIHASIQQEYTNRKGAIDEFLEFQLNYRLKFILISLGQFGFKLYEHGSFTQDVINKYGLLNTTPDCTTLDLFGLGDAETLRGFVNVLAKDSETQKNMLVLLECLLFLANEDGRTFDEFQRIVEGLDLRHAGRSGL